MAHFLSPFSLWCPFSCLTKLWKALQLFGEKGAYGIFKGFLKQRTRQIASTFPLLLVHFFCRFLSFLWELHECYVSNDHCVETVGSNKAKVCVYVYFYTHGTCNKWGCIFHWCQYYSFMPTTSLWTFPGKFWSDISILAAHWNHMGSFKIYWCLCHNPRVNDLLTWGCGLGTGIFKSSRGDSNVQPRLSTTALDSIHFICRTILTYIEF